MLLDDERTEEFVMAVISECFRALKPFKKNEVDDLEPIVTYIDLGEHNYLSYSKAAEVVQRLNSEKHLLELALVFPDGKTIDKHYLELTVIRLK